MYLTFVKTSPTNSTSEFLRLDLSESLVLDESFNETRTLRAFVKQIGSFGSFPGQNIFGDFFKTRLKNSLRPHDGNRIERKHYCREDQIGDGHEDDQHRCRVPE